MTKLRQRMLEDMAVRNLADNNQAAYLQQIIAYGVVRPTPRNLYGLKITPANPS